MKLYPQLLLRLLLMFALVGGGFLLYQHGLFYTSFFCLLLFLLLLAGLFSFVKNAFQFYDKTISAILNNDFSADFSKHSSFEQYRNLFNLYNHLKNSQNEQVSKDWVYRSILNNIETGVLILQKDESDWNIFLMNDYFSKHFMVPKVSKWHYLKNQLPALCEVIEDRKFEEIRTTIQIRIAKEDTQTFMLQASKTRTFEQDYYIILLDSIQKVIEKKEKDAWINLMKVISHELMNSITPIRSLTQNLDELTRQDSLSAEDLKDIRESIATMIHRSDHLQHFVESYRKLAMLPTPQKEKIALNDLVANALRIMDPLFKNASIVVTNHIDLDRWLNADKYQMEQVLINLLTNSMYALQEKPERNISISSEAKNNRIFITISDNGNGIEKEIEDKIFLPFFTTRKEGAGIGLTLSKHIVEAHGGYLNYVSEGDETKFVICMILK